MKKALAFQLFINTYHRSSIRFAAWAALTAAALWGTLPLQAAVVDRIIAIVNDQIITQSDIDRKLKPLVAKYQETYQGEDFYAKIDSARLAIVNRLINDALILDWAQKNKIVIDENIVGERLTELRSHYPDETSFEKMLIEENITIKELKDEFRNQMIIKEAVEASVLRRIIVSPNEVAKYYNERIENYTQDRAMKLSNILFKFKEASDKKAMVRQKADEAMARIKNGEDFYAIAREYSDGLNRHRGGDMGYVAEEELMPRIRQVLFGAPIGHTTDIIETDIGLHIFRVDNIRERSVQSLEEVSDSIRSQIYKERVKVMLDGWIDELKKNAYISLR